ncbi:hypothetical protein [Lyticum sinuosum]|uniref:DUF2066 domain-containing protein n=1 Tax=Lyticum sinuosum TaxID=1332059 RepID=A0AAE4VMC2_9RICK|nr:hypothetical protein [Lyticum sinuosum]MDZ5761458.1 hypothetical protein [Lyticum sinuosum]
MKERNINLNFIIRQKLPNNKLFFIFLFFLLFVNNFIIISNLNAEYNIYDKKINDEITSINKDDAFIVRGIDVSVVTDLSEEAKSQAFIKAEHEATRILVSRITENKSLKINNDVILPMIKHKEIVWERITHNSYRAKLDIHFNPQAVQSFLNNKGIRYGTEYTPKIVIFPIVRSSKKYKLWTNSIWQSSISDYEDKIGLLKFTLRQWKITDLIDIDHITAMSAPYNKFIPILKNHSAENIIVIYIEDIINNNRVEINLRFLNHTSNKYKFISYTKKENENEIIFTERIIKNLLEKIDMLWKGIDEFHNNENYSSILFIKSKDWPLVEKNLNEIKEINKIEFKENLGYKNFDNIIINYTVPPIVLSSLLKEKNIKVENKNGKAYIILEN